MGPQIQKISSREAVFHTNKQIKIPLQKIPFSHTFSRAKFQTALNAKLTPEMDSSELADTVKLILSL